MKFTFEEEENDREVDLEIDMVALKEVKVFKYLGSMIDNKSSMEPEITNRIQSGWANWRKCAGVL